MLGSMVEFVSEAIYLWGRQRAFVGCFGEACIKDLKVGVGEVLRNVHITRVAFATLFARYVLRMRGETTVRVSKIILIISLLLP